MLRFNALGTAALAMALAGAAPSSTAGVAVPLDVKIPVELTQQVTSLTAHVGDRFAFKTMKDETLGPLQVPAGTPGHGRIAIVQPARDKQRGTVSLQADSLDLPDGRVVWVNIDTSRPPTGHLSDKHTHFMVLPLPIGIVPGTTTTMSGNMVLDPGTGFRVVTIAPRAAPAPLLTAPPTPVPTSPATPLPTAT